MLAAIVKIRPEKLSLPNIQRTLHAKKWTRPVKWWSSSFLEQLLGFLAHLALQVDLIELLFEDAYHFLLYL